MTSEGHRRYVAGFMFKGSKVFLVRKNHPTWQAGLMNGIGGEIDGDETPEQAMQREYNEETGWRVHGWEFFATENGPGYSVHFFRYRMPSDVETASIDWKANDKGEELEWCEALDIKYPVIGNLHWLIPLALDPRPIQALVTTQGDIRKLATW